MRIRVTEVEKQRSCDCDCLHNNIVVESLVVVLTLISGLAITGENLIVFSLITVPLNTRAVSNISNSSNETSDGGEDGVITENTHVMCVMTKVFHYTSLAIAGLFFIEIVLKVCFLQKRFIVNPWQVVDTLVVMASLTLELTFHFVSLSQTGLYSLTYIVLLRLWRIPMLCNIRAIAVLQASEYDLELYRNGRIKAEDRCRMLETILTQRNEAVKKLEKMLHDLAGSKQTDLTHSDGHSKRNGHLPYKSELPSLMSPDGQSYSLVLRGGHKQSQYSLSGDTETEFISAYDIESAPSLNRVGAKLTTDPLYKQIEKNRQIVREDKVNNGNSISNTDTGAKGVDRKSSSEDENKTVVCSEKASASLTSPPPAKRSQIFLRSRKRRSSASEILDYINLSSPSQDSVFYDSSKSCVSIQNLAKDTFISKDKRGSVCTDNEDSTHNNVVSGGIDVIGPEESKNRQKMRRNRRFASCPEYVYTQRMNITNDESMLIGDGLASGEHFGYNNLGFDADDNLFFPSLTEYDGSTTYRNEDGIPMTSL
ncbi:hypothetical protein BsWGS_01049 [Bradybaena similaris]